MVTIGFCGTHSTGKTTVASLFAAKHRWPLVTNISRYVNSIGYGINEIATTESQAATSMARLAAQVKAEEEHGQFISDRTLLDSMAYNLYQLKHVWPQDKKSQFWYDTMDTIARHYMRRYDFVVYVPITFPLVHDGVRADDLDYQAWIDRAVVEILEDYGLEYDTMQGLGPEARVEWLENHLTNNGVKL